MSRKFSFSLGFGALAAAGLVIATRAAARAAAAEALAEGAVVLVTGGSRGLGYSIASRFAERPVRLVLTARSLPELQEAKQSLLKVHPHLREEDVFLVPADLSDPAACRHVVANAIGRFGRLDVLVNNAGIIGVGPHEVQPASRFEETMRVNFFAALHMTWAALPHMRQQQPPEGRKRRASIVNISSIGGKVAVPHMLPYTAAKFALTGFSEGLAAELHGKGVHVLTVCPGLMRTGGEDHAHFYGEAEKEKRWFKLSAKTPGLSTTPRHAAERIYRALEQGRSEIIITPQAWLGARLHGVAPGTVATLAGLANRYVLPDPPEDAVEGPKGEAALA